MSDDGRPMRWGPMGPVVQYTYVTREEKEAAGGSQSFLNRHGVENTDWWHSYHAELERTNGRHRDLIGIRLADGTYVEYVFEASEHFEQWWDEDFESEDSESGNVSTDAESPDVATPPQDSPATEQPEVDE